MRKRSVQLTVLTLLLAVSLTGCSRAPIAEQQQTVQLPDVLETLTCPEGQDALDAVVSVPIYLPDTASRRLLQRETRVTRTLGRSIASQTAQAVLLWQGDTETRPLSAGPAITMYGANPVTVAGGLCTVNLSASALALSENWLYAASLALCETLTGLEDIDHVVILTADQAPAMDIMGNLPMGALSSNQLLGPDERWDQLNARRAAIGEDPSRVTLTSDAALYYPTTDGSGVTPTVRTLAFAGQSPQQLTDQLLRSMQTEDGPYGTAGLQVLDGILAGPAEASDRIEGGRLITLRFQPDWEQTCKDRGIAPSRVLAAVTLTITGFVPSVPALEVLVDGEPLTSADGMVFADGVLRRNDFVSMVTELTEVRLRRGDRLCSVIRPAPSGSKRNPRVLLGLMLDGVIPSVDGSDVSSVLPIRLDESDILAIGTENDTMIVNLSPRFAQALRSLDADGERFAAYAIVNTLCEVCGMRRVAFRFDGEAVETLGGNVDWAGVFLPLPSMNEDVG